MKIILVLLLIYALGFTLALVRKKPASRRTKAAARGWGNRLRILIVGATGGTGRELIRQALDLGHEVTAFVRKPAKLKLEHPHLRVAKGNVLDYASVESAMQGQNAVICALGHKRWFYPSRILSRGTGNILQAMKTCGVPRFVCETSLGVGNSVGRLGFLGTFLVVPFILPFYFWDRLRQEKLIEQDDSDWVIVRPATLTNGAAHGQYRHGPRAGSFTLTKRISRADVADFMLKQLTDDENLGTAVGVS